MEINEVLNKYNISNATLKNWKKLNYINNLNDIKEEEIEKILNTKISVRRNKRNSVKNVIPISYIEDKRIIPTIEKIIELKNNYSVTNNEILHETIITILKNNSLSTPKEVIKILGQRTNNTAFKSAFKKINIKYSEDNDFLGCLYTSLLSVGNKDKNGIFYTPFKVVNEIIQSIEFNSDSKVLDPGCGSGNFLIQAYKKMKEKNIRTSLIIKNLYGFDTDATAVLLAKINIYILDKSISYNSINIYQKDFLNDVIHTKFDFVIGNPPWGKKYTPNEKKELKLKYDIAFSKMDSFAQFIIKSFELMNKKATLSFVLPTSILNIATHEEIRKFLLKQNIEYIKNIGREFEEVVTDAIIIKVIKENISNNCLLYNDTITEQSNFKQNPYCNFLIVDDVASSIIRKVKTYPSFHLIDNIDYALGIVTGDNKKYLYEEKLNNTEPIISGKEISRYNIDYSKINKFIEFDKDNLQQVANEDFYRCKNKIIYKFIGKKLCFAIENQSTLTLNSANIICLGEEYDLNYISAILNSRITQLYFEDTYNTHKVLKNHIQAFYIPEFNNQIKNKISSIVQNLKPQNNYDENIENIIYSELNLNDEEIKYLKNRF